MIDNTYDWLFPWPYRLFSVLALTVGIFMWPDNLLIILAVGAGGMLILTTHEGTEINTTNRTYRQYTSLSISENRKV